MELSAPLSTPLGFSLLVFAASVTPLTRIGLLVILSVTSGWTARSMRGGELRLRQG
jgi:hypothetical protein